MSAVESVTSYRLKTPRPATTARSSTAPSARHGGQPVLGIFLALVSGIFLLRSGKRSGTPIEQVAIEALGPPQRPTGLEGVSCGRGEHSVAVGPRACMAARVEAVGGLGGLDHRDLGG